MEFKDILKEVVIGKKIRRKHWRKDYFLKGRIVNNDIVDCFGEPFKFKITSFAGTDWEVYEEDSDIKLKAKKIVDELVKPLENLIKKTLERME